MGKRKQSRKWLNPLDSDDTGHVSYHIEIYDDEDSYIDAEFCISDCDRKSRLNFDCMTQKDVTTRVKKLRILHQQLEAFEKFFVEKATEAGFRVV